MTVANFADSLRTALGPDTVMVEPDDLSAYLSDWRGLYTGRAQAVVRPRTTADVSMCLRMCNEARIPVVPRGGNTGLCGGATPDSSSSNVVLSLERMHAIREVNTIANTLTAEAGCILGDLRRASNQAQRLFPLSLAAEDSSQIGGNLATNAGGVNVVRFGMMRDAVLGIEAVLPSGEVLNGLRTLRKDNTGYDLKQLMIGSEGTLGVITAASFKLYPRNDVRTVVVAAVDSPRRSLELFERLYEQCGQRVQAFEYFTGACLDLVLEHVDGVQASFATRHDHYVLIELADTTDEQALGALLESVVGGALEDGLCSDAVVSASLGQVEQMWRLREEISEAQRANGPHQKHDVSLPIGAIPDFMKSAADRLSAINPALRPFVFGHFGDGNLHYNVSRPLGAPLDFMKEHGTAITDAVLDEVMRYGGSISAEHGIGQLKREHFLHYKSDLELRLMRDIKRVFDPAGIMNPGKLL